MTIDHRDSNYVNLPNLERIDRVVFSMRLGLRSESYLFHPASRVLNRLLIYHQGHSGDFLNGKATIAFFLARGYAVLAFSMPLRPPRTTYGAVTLPSGEVVELTHDHASLSALEVAGIPTIPFFVDPVIRGIGYAFDAYNYEQVDMIGISGGGWTTTVMAAIDPRIRYSYPVAGSLPFDMRERSDVGDYEQLEERSIYEAASYLDMYVLASLEPHRRQLQVLNAFDPCCFSSVGRAEAVRSYEAAVRDVLARSRGGSFSVFIDASHEEHKISTAALKLIADDLERSSE